MTENTDHWTIKSLVTVLAVGMSVYHLNIAYTGGYEFVFQRSLSFLFGITLIILVYRHSDQTVWGKLLTALLFVLAVLSIGYPVIETDYLNGRLFYVDPLKTKDFILGFAFLSKVTAKTVTPSERYRRYNFSNEGISTRQGAHQVAQKLRTTTCPR